MVLTDTIYIDGPMLETKWGQWVMFILHGFEVNHYKTFLSVYFQTFIPAWPRHIG